ncbi:CLUMA_CG002845, isoform A [Clunio marinus]|uniref:CLUMA_CG002845, isoform A n=1 Tax=Clunio marinus TaxID=568069 RepID=A0A1J1HN93_9DIPT|nr:CLUMA_CG002845, isoform A [Clunio marinus]
MWPNSLNSFNHTSLITCRIKNLSRLSTNQSENMFIIEMQTKTLINECSMIQIRYKVTNEKKTLSEHVMQFMLKCSFCTRAESN